MSRARKERADGTVTVAVEDERLAALEQDMRHMRNQVAKLIELISAKPEKTARKPKATEAQLHELYIRRSFQMRQGKAAKRLGMSRESFVATYGDVDYVPKEKPKRRRRKKR